MLNNLHTWNRNDDSSMVVRIKLLHQEGNNSTFSEIK